MGHTVASQITTGTLDANVVVSANTIRVNSILIANSTAASVDVTLQDADGVNKGTITVGIGVSQEYYPDAMYDNGLTIASVSDATVVATVTHSADGA